MEYRPVRTRTPFIAPILLVCVALALLSCGPRGDTPIRGEVEIDLPFLRCGAPGEACCEAPTSAQNIEALGPLVSCQRGLGCDITTRTCVAPCGGPGQACCDGPETRALKWTTDGKVYSPNYWNMREMCDTGACDKQTHRCFTCGMQDGGPCCPPDAAQATARCVGENLQCEWDARGFYESGTCRACGFRGKPPCPWGCEPGLDVLKGVCDLCGAQGQPPCDVTRCKAGLGLLKGLCESCGGNRQVPCDTGCRAGLGLRHGLCVACGSNGTPPCDKGCQPGMRLINGVCMFCGLVGQPPCENGCAYGLGVAQGVCRTCGSVGYMPCDTGCEPGLMVSGGKCVPPAGGSPPQQSCAAEGQSCVADWIAGPHCCKSGGPLLCSYNLCRACVPHGEECKIGGPQICCNAKDGDTCVLDPATDKAICDLPD
jgi:hypothetical protein